MQSEPSLSSSEYQQATKQFAVYSKDTALEYVVLGMVSEAGEVAGKLSKLLRGDYADKSHDVFLEDINKEVGDLCWFISQYCNEVGTTIEQLMIDNIKKLTDRAERDKIRGSGDAR